MIEKIPFPPEPQKTEARQVSFRYLDTWELEGRYRSDVSAAANGEADQNNGQWPAVDEL